MPSLDGYSLNQKIDQTYEEVRDDIIQLQKDFHRLYQMLTDMKDNGGAKNEQDSKVPKAKKAKKASKVSEQVA